MDPVIARTGRRMLMTEDPITTTASAGSQEQSLFQLEADVQLPQQLLLLAPKW